MNTLEIPIGQKKYKISCREEEADTLKTFATKLNVLINSKAVELQTRVDNDYLLILVCLDLLQDKVNTDNIDVSAHDTNNATNPDLTQTLQTNTNSTTNQNAILSPAEQQTIKNLLNKLAYQISSC